MSTESKFKPLKEIRSCPLYCQTKGTNRCRRTSCQKFDLYLKILPCDICPPVCQYKGTPRCKRVSCLILNEYLKPENDLCNSCPLSNKKFCKVDCDKVTQWNSAWEWRQNAAPKYARVTIGKGKYRLKIKVSLQHSRSRI